MTYSSLRIEGVSFNHFLSPLRCKEMKHITYKLSLFVFSFSHSNVPLGTGLGSRMTRNGSFSLTC